MKTIDLPARLTRAKDRTADMFAVSGGEELTLLGQSVTQGETFADRCERATQQRAKNEPEQSAFF